MRDRCDPARGLSCLWSGTRRRHVCQQGRQLRVLGRLGRTPIGNSFRPCTPGSEYSSCRFSRSGAYEICRRASVQEQELYRCARTVTTLRRGENCGVRGFSDYVKCSTRTTCLSIPGVAGGYRTCVRKVRRGTSCTNKFRNQCGSGLNCAANGTCAAVPSPSSTPVTHTAIGGACNAISNIRPCVPGAHCVQGKCQLPKIVRREGEICFDNPRKNIVCAVGLLCQPAGNLGILKCLKPAKEGAVCTDNEECASELQCGPIERSYPFKRRCFDPQNDLPVGARCNPNDIPDRCVRTTITSKGGPQDFATMCLSTDSNAMKEGGTRYICAVPMPLMESCSEDFRCFEKGIKCSSYGVCL